MSVWCLLTSILKINCKVFSKENPLTRSFPDPQLCVPLGSCHSLSGEVSECERPPYYLPLHPTLFHTCFSFTHTFPTGMERHQPARGANRELAGFQAAHMAAKLWRTLSASIWILTLASSSRTRIYPPNEGECGRNEGPCAHGGCGARTAARPELIKPI